MTSSIFAYKHIYIFIYDWFYIHWLLLIMDLWNDWNKWNENKNGVSSLCWFARMSMKCAV